MPILGYRTQQSTDTTGTGPLALNAAPSAMRGFQGTFGTSARRVLYCISWATGFEIGHGQFDGGSPGALTRATVLASSNAGNPVALPAGTKDVFAVLEPNAREVLPLAAGATLSLADLGNLVVFTGAAPAILALPTIAIVPPGMGVLVRNSGTADLTVDPAGTETVNGGATVTLNPGFSAELFNTGTGWTALLSAPQNFGRIVGELIPIASTSLPPLCVWPNGQNLSRSAYAALFAALGTSYGVGDGSSTFGTPDLRGRALFGRDNLGGTAANRVTAGNSGIAGSTLGAGGGDERMPAHAHGVGDPWHAHGAWSGNAGAHNHGTAWPFGVGTSFDFDSGSWFPGPPSGTGPFIRIENTNYIDQGALIGWVGDHAHGIGIGGSGTGISIQTAGAGGSANMPPALIGNYALFAGV
ncbi:phage tail protein [Sediminicoccus sp. BL-A-41-H5]|uniref:phage tail protein n=1 Tax=Sediminicoccus sp. BL-A-41-H5 TaxID=3421106 RepID=UPI003D66DA71